MHSSTINQVSLKPEAPKFVHARLSEHTFALDPSNSFASPIAGVSKATKTPHKESTQAGQSGPMHHQQMFFYFSDGAIAIADPLREKTLFTINALPFLHNAYDKPDPLRNSEECNY